MRTQEQLEEAGLNSTLKNNNNKKRTDLTRQTTWLEQTDLLEFFLARNKNVKYEAIRIKKKKKACYFFSLRKCSISSTTINRHMEYTNLSRVLAIHFTQTSVILTAVISWLLKGPSLPIPFSMSWILYAWICISESNALCLVCEITVLQLFFLLLWWLCKH